jgi:hypothetical protein
MGIRTVRHSKLPDDLRDNEEAKILNAAACHKV